MLNLMLGKKGMKLIHCRGKETYDPNPFDYYQQIENLRDDEKYTLMISNFHDE